MTINLLIYLLLQFLISIKCFNSDFLFLDDTLQEGDECQFNQTLKGICLENCEQTNYDLKNFEIFPKLCSISDDNRLYCCIENTIRIDLHENQNNVNKSNESSNKDNGPSASEGDYCRHQNTKYGVCKSDCKKLEKLRRSGITPTKCQTDLGKNQLYCCPNLNVADELEKYRNLSSRRISLEKCQEYRFTRVGSRFTRKIKKFPKIPLFPTSSRTGSWDIIYEEFPHVAAIGWIDSSGRIDWHCGGSLISYDFVMTAAHCTLFNNIPPDIIRIGDQDLDVLEDLKRLPQNFTISKIIKHPDYSHFSTYNDIALIKLNQSVTITTTVRPACLWNDNDDVDDDLPTLSMGYGSTEFGGTNSRKLLKGNFTRYSHEDCMNIYKNIPKYSVFKNGLLDTQMCVGDPAGIQDTCRGDSGTPIEYLIDNVHYVYGITSFGQNCPSTVPGIYTKVSKYLDWIESIVWPNSAKMENK